MKEGQNYRFVCTLSFGDIYGQVLIWLVVIFLSLAAAMATMVATRPIYALAIVGLVLVVSIPFLLFAFVTTLLNHIELVAIDNAAQSQSNPAGNLTSPRPAEAAG